MRRPFAFCELHMGKSGKKRRIFRTAGIDSECDLTFPLCQMTDTDLMVDNTVFRAFDPKIILPPAQSVPHGFYLCRHQFPLWPSLSSRDWSRHFQDAETVRSHIRQNL